MSHYASMGLGYAAVMKGLKPYDNSHIPVLTLFFAPLVASQGQFPNFKRTAKQTVGAPGLANGDKAPRGMGEGRCPRSLFQKKRISILDLKWANFGVNCVLFVQFTESWIKCRTR